MARRRLQGKEKTPAPGARCGLGRPAETAPGDVGVAGDADPTKCIAFFGPLWHLTANVQRVGMDQSMKANNQRYLHTSFNPAEKDRIAAALAAEEITATVTEERSAKGGPVCYKIYVPMHAVPRALSVIQAMTAPAAPAASTAAPAETRPRARKPAAARRRGPFAPILAAALTLVAAALVLYSGIVAPFEHADANAMAAHVVMLAGVVVLVALYAFADRLRG